MSFWREVYPNEIYDLCYEDLVVKEEEEVRRLLENLDLPWEKKVFEFYKNPKEIRTASSMQVRQPIYRASSEAWKEYRPFLKDLEVLLDGY